MLSNNLESTVERKGTLVGTVNYMAPEMIQQNIASMATDIWCFGCIIFKILTGQVPFTGTQTFKVFQKILNKEIEYPSYLSPNAVSLIDQIIMINPSERLGTPGSRCDMQALKSHPFFDGIDFDNLSKYNMKQLLEMDEALNPTLMKKKNTVTESKG